jgi:glutamate synthase (NADPH) small chain
MAVVKSKDMGHFETERKSFEIISPGQREDKAAKRSLPVFSPVNHAHSAAGQACACANCKDQTCSSLGCPKGNQIGSANVAIMKAGKAANDAFNLLKDRSKEKAREFSDIYSRLSNMDVPDYGLLEDELFTRLAKIDREAARMYQERFQRHMTEAFKYFGGKKGRSWVYGMVCPSESMLCGSKCQIEFAMARGITIAMNEAAVAAYMMRKDLIRPVVSRKPSGNSIAIIGSGAVSFHLGMESRDNDHAVMIFEKNCIPGELGDGKILNYKLPLETWQFDIDLQEQSGIEFQCGTPIGAGGKPFRDLTKGFNVVVIAIGNPAPNDPGVTGDGAGDVVSSAPYLQSKQNRDYNKKFLGSAENLPPEHNAKDKQVVILGTGDSAVDAAFAALEQGAVSITLVSRHKGIGARDRGDRKAYERLEKEAGDKLRIQYDMEAGTVSKQDGCYVVEGSGKTLQADMVISAIGNNPGKLKELLDIPNLPVTKSGTIEIQLPALSAKSVTNGILGGFVGMFNGTAVFAGGEVVTGPSLLVTAGKAGIDLAAMIDEYLDDPDSFLKKTEEISGRAVMRLDRG